MCGMGRRRPRLTLMSRSFFSLHSIGHLKKKRESESESGVATARDGAPAMVSSSMMLPVYPSPSISYSEASWKHNKKFAKELSIEEEDHQLRSWFLHRWCSCALLRYMHVHLVLFLSSFHLLFLLDFIIKKDLFFL